MGIQTIPAVLYSLLVLTIPESPRWLVSKSRNEEAKSILKIINPSQNIDEIIIGITANDHRADKTETIFIKKYRFPLILAFLIALFNQLSGINAFLYYAPRIFQEAGLGESTALLSSIGIGITNLIFTLIGVALIDKLGRKTLMYLGSFGYIISLSLVAMAFFYNWQGIAVPAFLFLFIASHAIGQGSVIWVFISEIFPNHLRASGQSFGSSTHWIFAAIIPSLVPVLFASIGAGVVFLFFAVMMFLQLLFVHFLMPETKGVSLETLSETLSVHN